MFIRYNDIKSFWEYDSAGGTGAGPWADLPVNFPTGIYERGRSLPQGEWQLFTSALRGDNASVAVIGNGSLDSQFTIIGKTVFFRIQFFSGSTTVFPTGNIWGFDMVPGYPITYGVQIGSAFLYGPAGILFSGSVVFGAFLAANMSNKCTIVCAMNALANGARAIGPTIPFTWAVNNYCYIEGNYITA